MKYPAMTQQRRDDVVRLLIAHAFAEQTEALSKLTADLGPRYYDLMVPPADREIIDTVPKRYFQAADSFKLNWSSLVHEKWKDGLVRSVLIDAFQGPWDIREALDLLPDAYYIPTMRSSVFRVELPLTNVRGQCVPIPTTVTDPFIKGHMRSFGSVDVGADVHAQAMGQPHVPRGKGRALTNRALYKATMSVMVEWFSLASRAQTYAVKAREMLEALKTTKQLQDKWPEAFALYQQANPDEFKKQLPAVRLDDYEDEVKALKKLARAA